MPNSQTLPVRRLRVVLLDPNANTPPYDHALCRALAEAGCETELATAPFIYGKPPPARGYRVRQSFFRLARGRLARSLSAPQRQAARRLLRAIEYPLDWSLLIAALERQRPDVLHVQWSLSPLFDERCWRWLRRRGVPIVYTAHDLLPHEAGPSDVRRYRRLYQAAEGIMVHTRRSAEELVARFSVRRRRVHVAPHGPLLEDERELGRDEARRQLGLPLWAPLILFAGLIEPYKGLGDLIDAFAELARGLPTARLVVAGRPNEPFEPYCRALARNGLMERAHLDLRYLSQARFAAYLCAADVVALPYRRVTSSGLLLAARRFGKPVVATAVGDLAELVEDGHNGLLVPSGDARALAGALSRVLRDPSLGHRLGEEGRRLTMGEHSWAETARRTIDVYRSLL